jgi:hypothetical protein
MFQKMVASFRQSLYCYFAAHANGDAARARQLTLATFSFLYDKPVSVPNEHVASWLFGVAWEVLNTEFIAIAGAPSVEVPDLHWTPRQKQDLQSLRCLPFYPREALYLRFFANLDPAEIALLMDKTDLAVNTLVLEGVRAFDSRRRETVHDALPRKQLVSQARIYDDYLDDVLSGNPPKLALDSNLTAATQRLIALRRALTMKADVSAQIEAEMQKLSHPGNGSATRL